jgi:hypothetical protein
MRMVAEGVNNMVKTKSIFAFICFSLVFWFASNYFVPIFITVDVIESKFIYFLIKNFTFVFLVTLSAVVFLEQMAVRKVAVWLLFPIVIFPVLFSVLTFYIFINASATTLRDLVVGSIAESFMYWVVACGIFWVIRRWWSAKSIVI